MNSADELKERIRLLDEIKPIIDNNTYEWIADNIGDKDVIMLFDERKSLFIRTNEDLADKLSKLRTQKMEDELEEQKKSDELLAGLIEWAIGQNKKELIDLIESFNNGKISKEEIIDKLYLEKYLNLDLNFISDVNEELLSFYIDEIRKHNMEVSKLMDEYMITGDKAKFISELKELSLIKDEKVEQEHIESLTRDESSSFTNGSNNYTEEEKKELKDQKGLRKKAAIARIKLLAGIVLPVFMPIPVAYLCNYALGLTGLGGVALIGGSAIAGVAMSIPKVKVAASLTKDLINDKIKNSKFTNWVNDIKLSVKDINDRRKRKKKERQDKIVGAISSYRASKKEEQRAKQKVKTNTNVA